MNQDYFYTGNGNNAAANNTGLNPFMNQVYFYGILEVTRNAARCVRLNPFMNQVYFYRI